MKKIDRQFNQGILEDTYTDGEGIFQHYQEDITKLIEDNKRKQSQTCTCKHL